MTEPADDVLFERTGGIGVITLNRPKALNAFTLDMYHRIEPVLDAWDADPAVNAIVVKGAGGKAYSAGGDIRALWETGPGVSGPDDLKRVFFIDEYRVIRKVHRLTTPYVALLNGITMGGGVGMSVNGRIRVATDNTLFAMPETGIGMVPDVGGSRFLRLCPGWTGRYLGLTGARLKAADMLHAGLATHFVPAAGLDDLVAALSSADWSLPGTLAALLDAFSGDPGPAALRDLEPAIDRCFGGDSIDSVLAALAAEGTEWADKTLATLRRMSPSSLCLTFGQLRSTEPLSIEQSLTLDFNLVQRVMNTPDFFEGVRAMLVDKDQNPVWNPATLDGVDRAAIERVLATAFEPDPALGFAATAA